MEDEEPIDLSTVFTELHDLGKRETEIDENLKVLFDELGIDFKQG